MGRKLKVDQVSQLDIIATLRAVSLNDVNLQHFLGSSSLLSTKREQYSSMIEVMLMPGKSGRHITIHRNIIFPHVVEYPVALILQWNNRANHVF